MWGASIGRGVALLVGAALLAVACGTPTAPAGAPAKPVGQSSAGAGAAGSEPAAGAASQAAPSPRQHVRVSYGASVGSMVPIIAANKLAEWESEGLDVDVKQIPSNTSVAALVAGELDLV